MIDQTSRHERSRPTRRRDQRPSAVDPLEQRLSLSSAAMSLVGLSALRADPFYSQFTGAGQTVVVIDQPIDWTSPQLASRRVTDIPVLGTFPPITGETHGTFVASIIGASDPSIGVAPGAGIIGVTSDGQEPPAGTNPGEVWRLNENDIERLLDWVIENRHVHNIVAVNMSLGDGRFYTSLNQVAERVLNDEIRELEDAGIVVIASAGNDYEQNQTLNASYPAIAASLAVGAVYAANVGPQGGDLSTGPDRIAAFSQRPAGIQGNALFAPGAGVRGVIQGSQQGVGSGTSFAAPYVSGAVAILQQAAIEFAGERLGVEELLQIIFDTSDIIIDGDDEDDTVVNTGESFPRIDVLAALQEIERRYSDSAVQVLGGGSLQHLIVHDAKGERAKGTGFGPVERDGGQKTSRMLITNTGDGTLRFDSVRLRGQSPEQFAILAAPSAPLAPGESAELVVRFDPSSYGVLRARVEITSNAQNQGVFHVRLKGRGVPPPSAPDIAITGATKDIRAGSSRATLGTGTRFESVALGSVTERTFTVRNDGGSSLSINVDLLIISGANASDFAISVRPASSVLGVGESSSFTVVFAPGASGVRKANVLLLSSDPDETPFVFRIAGAGL